MVPSKVLNLTTFVPAKDDQLSRSFYRDLGFHENWAMIKRASLNWKAIASFCGTSRSKITQETS
jgi:hypothetical protein